VDGRSHCQILLPNHLDGKGHPTYVLSWMHIIYTSAWERVLKYDFDVLRYYFNMIIFLFTLGLIPYLRDWFNFLASYYFYVTNLVWLYYYPYN